MVPQCGKSLVRIAHIHKVDKKLFMMMDVSFANISKVTFD